MIGSFKKIKHTQMKFVNEPKASQVAHVSTTKNFITVAPVYRLVKEVQLIKSSVRVFTLKNGKQVVRYSKEYLPLPSLPKKFFTSKRVYHHHIIHLKAHHFAHKTAKHLA
jgi:hypothetical protein